MSVVFSFFFGKFVKAFVIGIIFRLVVALMFRQDYVSFWGFINTGLFFGVAYDCLWWYYLAGF